MLAEGQFFADPDVRATAAGYQRAERLVAAGGARHVIVDVDGCLTPGWQVVDADGEKPVKVFGLDDLAALRRWGELISITAVTSDLCAPTIARMRSWELALAHAPAEADQRLHVIRRLTGDDYANIVYIGDGYHDAAVMRRVAFGIAPSDAWPETARAADAVTSAAGGRRAVALALDFIGENLLSSCPGQEQ